jgi:ankyrin repeat protein
VKQLFKARKNVHTLLSAAVHSGHGDLTLLLLQLLVLQHGFDINQPRLALNQPLLCCVATTGLCKVAEFALDHGADPNMTAPNGPPLIVAVKTAQNDMVNLLCQRGANKQTRFDNKNSLDEAVIKGDLKIVKTLIRHGVEVNVRVDSSHFTAVMQAAVLGKYDIVQLLLDAGAVFDAKLQHETLIICTSKLCDETSAKVVKLLLPHCSSFADNNYELGNELQGHAVSEGKLQVARLLHAAGADMHTKGDNCTLIHYAAQAGNLAVVKWLQSLGLDPRAESE